MVSWTLLKKGIFAMHPQQKHARFNLIVISCALLPTLILYAFLLARYGPKVAMAAFGCMGICGLMGFGGSYYSKRNDSPAVLMDERDQDIKRRAMLAAWGVTWLAWGVLCMGPWSFVAFRDGIEQTEVAAVPVGWLPLVYMLVFVIHQVAWSIAVLVLYGKGADRGEA
jgi:hypothetical protein